MPITPDDFHIPIKWFHHIGFPLGDPFETREVSREPESALVEYFVAHPAFEEIAGSARKPHSAILVAARGCGKTTARRVLEWQCRAGQMDAPALAVPYLIFDRPLRHAGPDGEVPLRYHVEEILSIGLRALFDALADRPERADAFRGGLRDELAYFLRAYTDLLTVRGLDRWLDGRGLLGQTEAAALLRGDAPPDDPFLSLVAALAAAPAEPHDPVAEPPVALFETFVAQARRAGYAAVFVLIDRVDEREPMASDPERGAALLARLATNLPFLETPDAAVKLFLTPEVAKQLTRRPGYRRDRLPARTITWSEDELVDMLDRRVQVFSAGRLPSLDAVSETGAFVPRMAAAAGGSPRNLLRLGGWLFYCRHLRAGEGSNPTLTTADLACALAGFAAEEEAAALPVASSSSAPFDEALDEADAPVVSQPAPAARPIRIDPAGKVWVGTRRVEKLSDKQYKLLAYLLANEGVVCQYEKVGYAVYGTEYDDLVEPENALEKLVQRLRRELGELGRKAIRKHGGARGYVLEQEAILTMNAKMPTPSFVLR